MFLKTKYKSIFILLFVTFPTLVLGQVSPVEELPYNLHGVLNGQKIRVHIGDNKTKKRDNYFYYLTEGIPITLLPIQVSEKYQSEIFDIWEEIGVSGEAIGYFFITTFPLNPNIKGTWMSAEDSSIRYDFRLYHVLEFTGKINGRSIQVFMEYTGKKEEKRLYYEGYYTFAQEERRHKITGNTYGNLGFEEIIEYDENDDFIAFFEFDFSQELNSISWKSADGLQDYRVELFY